MGAGVATAAFVCAFASSSLPPEGQTDLRSDFPVRQIVLSEGVLYAIDSEPSPGHCAMGLVRPLDSAAKIERLPLVGMCALEIGRGPYPWCIDRGTFTYVTVTEPPGDPQVSCRVAQPSMTQLRQYRGVGVHPLARLNGAPRDVSRGFGALAIERTEAALRNAEMDFHASMHSYDVVLLYALRRGELRVWRSVADEADPRRTKEQAQILTLKTSMEGPFRVVRFAKRDYLLDVTGILYEVERDAVKKVGHVPDWPQGEKLSTKRQYILLYDAKLDSSRLYLLTPEALKPLEITQEDPQRKVDWSYAEFPESAEEVATEVARLTWGDVLRRAVGPRPHGEREDAAGKPAG